MSKCFFCGGEPAISDEDAWPVWLMKLWREITGSKGKFENRLIKGRLRDDHVVRQWHGGHRVGGFCVPCNTQWMSRIEKRAKPILTPMILGQEVGLGPAQQKAVSRWAYLKTLVFVLSNPGFSIPEAEYHRFKTRRKPPHGSVILLSGATIGYPGSLHRLDPVDVVDADGITGQNYRSTFVIGHLILQVMGRYPGKRRMLSGPARSSDPSHSIRIWRTGSAVTFPPDKKFEPGQIEQLLELFLDRSQPPDQTP